MGRFIRKELLANKPAKEFSKINSEGFENHLAFWQRIGNWRTNPQRNWKVFGRKTKFVLELMATTKHLVSKLPLDNIILRSSKALKPDAGSEDWSLKAIKILAKKLKVSMDLDKLSDECRIYQLETITEDWYKEFEEPQKFICVDHFWRKIDDLKDVMGQKKFPSIMKVVKTALIPGHGNAEVERGFSERGKIVTDDRVRLSEASINGICATTDGLKAFKGPGSVPITKQLLQLGRSAHAHYVLRLDKDKKEKEEAQKQLTLQKEQAAQMEAQKQQLAIEKKDLNSKEKELERQEAAQQECMEVADTILKEANAKLRAAVRNKVF